MTKRQIAFGVICFQGDIPVGMEFAGKSKVFVRLVITVAILLLFMYLALPYPPARDTSKSLPCATHIVEAYGEEAVKRKDRQNR